ncbi:M48 family metalloprotease [Sphingomonas sp.]|uniref:M48 family metalloprotease n=1 Tax=Sphingomonas sp. TaxID=28214 RepID=UPI0038B291A3
MSGADQDLLAHIGRRPLYRILHPLRRLEAFKIVAGLLVISVTVAQHMPAEWMGGLVPAWAEQRLVDGVVAQDAPARCSHPGGERAVRTLLLRLDPQLGKKVDIVALRNGGFAVTSTPGQHIFMLRGAMSEIASGALPALLAHELSHIRHGDPTVAIIRENGFLKTWATILDGNERPTLQMRFSGLEERRADLEAMQMMRNAGVPLKPASEMFEQMRISKEQGGFFGYDQRDFHFGIDARAQRWAAAARSDPTESRPILTPNEEDALYNFCWTGPIAPLPRGARPAPEKTAPLGVGGAGRPMTRRD